MKSPVEKICRDALTDSGLPFLCRDPTAYITCRSPPEPITLQLPSPIVLTSEGSRRCIQKPYIAHMESGASHTWRFYVAVYHIR